MPERSGLGPLAWVGGGLIVVLTLFLLLGGLLVGARSRAESDQARHQDGGAPGPTSTMVKSSQRLKSKESVESKRVAVRRPDAKIVLAHRNDPLPKTRRVLDKVDEFDTVLIKAAGFSGDSDGVAAQCSRGMDGPKRCADGVPVTFGWGGESVVLVETRGRAEMGGETVDCHQAPGCEVAVRSMVDGVPTGDMASIPLVFGQRVSRFEVKVASNRDLHNGEKVRIAVDGLPPGSIATVTQCEAPDLDGSRRCGSPADVVALRVGDDGRGAGNYRVTNGRVGDEGSCGRRFRCVISVTSDPAFMPSSAAVPLVFANRPGAEYDRNRLLAGGGLALLLLGLATALIKRTDWSPIGGDPFAGVEVVKDW